MDTITITVAENDPDVVVSATLNEEAVTITLVEAQDGATGAGVAAGGSANDILKKTSSTDYATEWETPTSTATANAVVRRNASGGAAFVALTGTGNWSTTGHFLSNPGTGEAGHFITANGTTPTIAVGRSVWFSSTAGAPQFKNGTGSAVTLIYNSGALGTPSSGTLTNCTGLPVSTGISGLAPFVASYLEGGSALTFRDSLSGGYTGSGSVVFANSPSIDNPTFTNQVTFNAADYNYAPGVASAHRTALGLTALATTTPGTNVAAFLATPTSANLAAALTDETGTGAAVFGTSPTITTPVINQINPTTILQINGAGAAGLFGLKSTSATGYSSLELINSANTQMGGFGYANASAGAYADQVYFYASGKPLMIATAAGSRHFYMDTTGAVSIGSGSTPSTKAILDLTSTTKGFLPPRMTTTQRDAITSVPAGLMVYNTTTNKLNFYNGSAWEAVTSA